MAQHYSWWRSLKTRLTLFTLVVFLIGIWSLALYASRILRENMQRQLGEEQFSTVSLLAAHVNEELQDRLAVLELVAKNVNPTILGNKASLQKLLQERPLLQRYFNSGVFVIGPDGTAIADFPLLGGRIGFNYLERDFAVAALKDGKSTIGQPVIGKIRKSPLFSMAAPIRNTEGKVIGALAGTVDLGKPNFLDAITQSKYGKTGGYILVAPRHRLIVTATDKSYVMQPIPAPGVNPLFDRYAQGFEGYGSTVDARGVHVWSSSKQIPIAGWMLVGRIPALEALAPIHSMEQRLLLATAMFTLLAGCLIWWMTWRLLKGQLSPMLHAAAAIDTMSEGSGPPRQLPITSRDEIGELIGGFNRLLRSLGQREAALAKSESRFRDLTEMSSDWYWEQDEKFRFTYVSHGFYDVVGAESAILGMTRWELPHKDTDPQLMREHDALLAAHKPFTNLVIKRIGHDNTIHYAQISGKPTFDEQGQFSGYRGVAEDITERIRDEQSIRNLNSNLERSVAERTAILEQALQDLESFSYSTSHDLRTPLRAINGFAEVLLQTERNKLSDEGRHLLDRIAQAAVRLGRLIDDVLEYSRIGRVQMMRDAVDLNLLCRTVADEIQALYPQVQIARGPLPTVTGDSTMLKQVLQNLIENACKFTANAADSRVEVGTVPNAGNQVVYVKDNGVGFDMSYAGKLFRMFERLHTENQFPGSGVGLAIVKRLIERHGGRIWVESEPGKGASFFFTLEKHA